MWWLIASAPDVWDRGPGFESGISHNDPDALPYPWGKKKKKEKKKKKIHLKEINDCSFNALCEETRELLILCWCCSAAVYGLNMQAHTGRNKLYHISLVYY